MKNYTFFQNVFFSKIFLWKKLILSLFSKYMYTYQTIFIISMIEVISILSIYNKSILSDLKRYV